MLVTIIVIAVTMTRYNTAVLDAMNNYDGGNRQVTGQYATAGIWSTYPQPFLSIWNGLADQVLIFYVFFIFSLSQCMNER